MTKYFIFECSEPGCLARRAPAQPTRKAAEMTIREDGWKLSKKAWYCPLHRPHTGGKDKAPVFATQWRRLVGNDAELIGLKLYPMPEYKFDPTRGFSADFAFVDHMLLLEIDGGTWLKHGGRHNTDKDREKLNRAAVLGWRVIRFSTQQLDKDPVACVNTVLAGLGADQITFR